MSTTIAVLLVLGLPYAAFAGPTMFQFYTYCDRVAKATGRDRENQEIWKTDDGGNAAFQRGQLRKLRRGEYTGLEDPVLVAQGRRIALKLRLSWWLAVGLVVSVAATDLFHL